MSTTPLQSTLPVNTRSPQIVCRLPPLSFTCHSFVLFFILSCCSPGRILLRPTVKPTCLSQLYLRSFRLDLASHQGCTITASSPFRRSPVTFNSPVIKKVCMTYQYPASAYEILKGCLDMLPPHRDHQVRRNIPVAASMGCPSVSYRIWFSDSTRALFRRRSFVLVACAVECHYHGIFVSSIIIWDMVVYIIIQP